MKKSDLFFIFISLAFTVIFLNCTSNSLKGIGLELLFLSIGLITIFILNKKKLLIPINLKNINCSIALYTVVLSLLASLLTAYVVCTFSYFNLNYLFQKSASYKITLLSIFTTIIISPICEEMLFRAAILGILIRKIPVHLSIFIQCIIFAFLHGLSFKTVTFYTALIGGFILGYVFYYTKSILSSILCHSIYNFMSIFAGILSFKISNTSTLILCLLLCSISIYLTVYCITKIKTLSKQPFSQ
ncbi:CAAX protease [Clostridium acetobutylicum]|nr:CAAX protease [Clostridium acetobutylicum]